MKKEIDPVKLLDMIRSILPSTARKAARKAKALENRAARRTGREANHRLTIEDRRARDKIRPFIRWCEHHTRHLKTTPQKLEAIRAILPNTLLGHHAYNHWKLHLGVR